MEKPCLSDHGDYREGCRVCHLWKTDPRYAAGPGKPVPPNPIPAVPPLPACTHRGTATGKTVGCRTCSGPDKLMLPVLSCAIFGECVTGERAPASNTIQACRWCEKHSARV